MTALLFIFLAVTASAGPKKPNMPYKTEADFYKTYESLKKYKHELTTSIDAACKGETCLLYTVEEKDEGGAKVCNREIWIPKKEKIRISLSIDAAQQGAPISDEVLAAFELERGHLLSTGHCKK